MREMPPAAELTPFAAAILETVIQSSKFARYRFWRNLDELV